MHGYKWPINSPRTHIEEEAEAAEAATTLESEISVDPAPELVDGHHVDDELRRH